LVTIKHKILIFPDSQACQTIEQKYQYYTNIL